MTIDLSPSYHVAVHSNDALAIPSSHICECSWAVCRKSPLHYKIALNLQLMNGELLHAGPMKVQEQLDEFHFAAMQLSTGQRL